VTDFQKLFSYFHFSGCLNFIWLYSRFSGGGTHFKRQF
jgi:hypothetical protein